MLSIKYFIIIVFVLLCPLEVYPQQKVQDFYLSNYKENGSKKWEVNGKKATMRGNYVDIEDMKAKYFQNDDTIDIKSDKAKLDKRNMDVYLKDHVRVSDKKGVVLHSDALNWKKSSNNVSTDTKVDIEKKKSIKVNAVGMDADTALNKVKFKKNVKANLFRKGDVIKINCDGPLNVDYNKGVAVFNKNVVVDSAQGKMFAHKATVYFDPKKSVVVKIIAEGDVKVIRDDNVTFSERAVYLAEEGKIMLKGKPRLVIFSKEKSKLFNKKK